MQKISYLVSSAFKLGTMQGMGCPSCGSHSREIVDRKWIVTSLRRCPSCHLLYRTPTTSTKENDELYQEDYKEGFTTTLPKKDELSELLKTGFSGGEKDYRRYIEILQSLGAKPGARLFDYGCSWGYGSWQFRAAGYQVDSYEISKPRAEYGRTHLNINLVRPEQIKPSYYDVFFSSHVIEHVPSVEEMIQLGLKALRPGGLFIAFTPNGGDAFRKQDPHGFHKMWGLVHPQLIDSAYLARLASTRPMVIDTHPYSLDILQSIRWEGHQTVRDDGPELMFAIRKTE